MRVVATAGHVDHGKSTLIRALTGIDPDRLREERERGMTIDLGFAWLRLPRGEDLGIVDVPGHQDFIRNMLAGVGGIDAVLLVVALDEGVMPQTREHLAILGLLGVEKGVVALTKRDLVDAELAALVREDVRATLRGTPLEAAPFVEVSATSRAGLDELVTTLERVLGDLAPRRDLALPRLPIDRAFTMSGFGAVVTGTLRDGTFAVGEEVEIVPGGLRARIRGLQTHRQKIERAVPGSRVAMNLAGVDAAQLARGMVVARPGKLRPTEVVASLLELLPTASRELEHGDAVKVHVGTAEVMASVSLLEGDALADGASGWAQLRLAEPVAVVPGDRFVIRYPSPAETIGGGAVADATLGRLRRGAESVAALRARSSGSVEDRVAAAFDLPATREEASRRMALPRVELDAIVSGLVAGGRVVELDPFVVVRERLEELAGRARVALAAYHGAHPLRRGMPKEELRAALRADAKLWPPLLRRLVADGLVTEHGATAALATHRVVLPPAAERAWTAARARLAANETQPPSTAELGLDQDAVVALAERGDLVRLAPDMVLLPETARRFGEAILSETATAGKVSVSRARDLTGSSRKYVLPLLQFLDDSGITRRVGDERVLVATPEEARARLRQATGEERISSPARPG